MPAERLIIGCGYLGRRVAERWRLAGDHVTVLTRSEDRAAQLKQEGLQPLVGDVLDPASLKQLPRVATVLLSVGFDRSSGADFRTLTVDGMRNLLASLAGQSDRILSISSTSVYGQHEGELVDETSPTEPDRPNGAACLEAEQLLARTRAEFAQQNHSPLWTVVLRLAGIYGPGRMLRRLDQLRSQEPLSGKAEAWLNLIHVDDAARAVCAAAEHPQPAPLYLVADDAPVQRRDFYATLSQLTGSPPPVFDEDAASEGNRPRSAGFGKRCDNQKLRAELLDTLEYPTWQEGLRHAVQELREQNGQ